MHTGSGCGNTKDSDHVEDPVYRRRISASPVAVLRVLIVPVNSSHFLMSFCTSALGLLLGPLWYKV